MSEAPYMPTKPEILALAIKMFQEDMIRKGIEPITPTERELKEGNWFEKARLDLMTGVKSQLEEHLTYLETEAESIRDQLGIAPAPPPREVRELVEQIDVVSGKLRETRGKLREAKETIEKLRAVKVPPKIVEAPPPPPKVPVCPAHKVELIPVIGAHQFRWGRIEVPSEMFLFQCPIEFEYYICEPRKACELVSLDKLKLKLVRIIKPIVPSRVPPARRLRVPTAEIQPDFPDYLRECGITLEEYRRLDHTGKTVMRNEYRRWKEQPY